MPERLVNDKSIVFIGIDPGAKGAVTAINWDGEILDCISFPFKSGKAVLEEYPYVFDEMDRFEGQKVCCIEQVGARRGNSANSMFTFGVNYGMCLGLCYQHSWEVYWARPQEWMSFMHGEYWNDPTMTTKERSIAMTKDLKPGEEYWRRHSKHHGPGKFWGSRSIHDGKVESYLIAEYNRNFKRGLFDEATTDS